MRNHHATPLNTATCAQEYFRKLCSLNSLTVHPEMPHESLLHKEKAIH